MRHAIAFLFLTATVCTTTFAEPIAVTLRVKRLATVKDVEENWKSSWGSYDRDFSRSLAIDISVFNLRSTPSTVTLEVLFVAKPLSGSGRWVFDRVEEELKLDGQKEFRAGKLSKELLASVQNYESLGTREQAGGKIEGYIVRILDGQRIVKVEASSNPLKKIGEDQEQVDEMVKAGLVE